MISDIVIAIVIGYLLGSIPSAYLAGREMHGKSGGDWRRVIRRRSLKERF